jgi:tetratricopeptide (TPR) repeat protein
LSALAGCQVENKEIGNAIISYEQVLMMNPKAAGEQKILGDLYFKEGRDSIAFETYLKYLEKDPTDARIALKVGTWLYSRKRYEEAVKNYSIAKKILKDENAVRYAHACFETGMYSELLAILLPLKPNKKIKGQMQRRIYRLVAEAFEKDSEYVASALAYGDYAKLPGVNDPEAAFKHALYLEKKDPLEAGKIYETNIKKYPSDYRNYLHLGLLYSERKDQIAKAVPMFKRVTELADSLPKVWLELGRIYRKMGKDDDELNAYKKYSEKFPQDLEANQRIGIILIRKNRYNEGIVFLEIANTQAPGDPETMAALAKGYVRTNRNDEAIKLLIKAKEKDSENPDIRFQLFELYQAGGRKEEAQKEIEALIEMNRETRYMLLYAEALSIQGKVKEAAHTVEEILAVDPESVATLMLKGRLLREQKKYDEAVEIYKEISYIDAKNAGALFERAETHLLQSKPQWAESFYNRALRLNPSLGRAELGLAKIAKIRKNTTAYKMHLENARRLSPDDELILEELKKAGM